MSELFPVGTYVRVTVAGRPADIGKVVGYDIGHSKYEIGIRYGGWGEWLFLDGGTWAFPSEVEAIDEAEALKVEAEA